MFSFVIPCYNEESMLVQCYQEISAVLTKNQIPYELIFVNDGSSDRTLDILKEICQNDKKVSYLSFSRNFGKEAAMLAGLSYATGEAVVTMDADLQHPPFLIPQMVQAYRDGYDQVIAKRSRKGERKRRTWLAKLYYRLMNYLVDVELTDGVGDFRLLSRRAVDALLSLQEYTRFSKGLYSWIGFEQYVIEYENVLREKGTSKWTFGKMINYGLDGLISFNDRPLRLAIYMGMLVTTMDILYIAYIFMQIILFGIAVPGYFTIIASVGFLGGIQLISIGVIGEYIGRIYYETKRRPHYIIADQYIGAKRQEESCVNMFSISKETSQR
jgi:glycosyltransferase involved in cell wall biosynthesis